MLFAQIFFVVNIQIIVTYVSIFLNICLSINFNNLLKVCFSNKKYRITIQTPPTQIVISKFLKTVFKRIFKD